MFERFFGQKAKTDRLSPPSFAIGDAQGFWAWYVDNAEAIGAENLRSKSAGGPPSERFIDAIRAALKRFDENLVFEMGIASDGVHEFVVSADGVRDHFPSVTRLVSSAPRVDGHRFLAFRQRDPGVQISVNGTRIGGDSVNYEILGESETALDIRIFLPHVEALPESDQGQIMFLLLDSTLGENDVATSIGCIEHRMLDPGEISPGKPLSVLAAEIDARSGRGLRH